MGLAFARRSFRNGTTDAKRLSKTVWPALPVSETVSVGTGTSPKFDQSYCGMAMSALGQKQISIIFQSAVAYQIKREPRVPLTGPQGDDEKYAPCPLYPPLAQRCLRGVGGCHHRSSRIRPRRSARARAIAAADCANPLPPCP